MARPTNIDTPDQLSQIWEDYKQDLKQKESEWERVQYVGKDGERKSDPVKLPYTLEGLKLCTSWKSNLKHLCTPFIVIHHFSH